jgi:hypothetical protein
MLRRVTLVRTDVSEELSASFIRMIRIGELGTTLAVTSNRRTLRRNTNFKYIILGTLEFYVSHFLLSHCFMNNAKPRPTEMTTKGRSVSNLKCNLINTAFPADLSCQMTSRKQLVIHPSWIGAYNNNYKRNAPFFRVFIRYVRCISCAKMNRWHPARGAICAHIRGLC